MFHKCLLKEWETRSLLTHSFNRHKSRGKVLGGATPAVTEPAIIPQTSFLSFLDTQVNDIYLPILQLEETRLLSSGQCNVSRNAVYHFKTWPTKPPRMTLRSLSPSASLIQISTVTSETSLFITKPQFRRSLGSWIITWREVSLPVRNTALGFCVRNKCQPYLSHYSVWGLFVIVARITLTNVIGFSVSRKKVQKPWFLVALKQLGFPLWAQICPLLSLVVEGGI